MIIIRCAWTRDEVIKIDDYTFSYHVWIMKKEMGDTEKKCRTLGLLKIGRVRF